MTARSHHTGMAVIAVFKVVKGLLLLFLGLGLLKLVHAEIATLFSLLIEALHLNADSRLVHSLVLKVDALQPHSVLLAGLSRLFRPKWLLTLSSPACERFVLPVARQPASLEAKATG